MSGNPRESGARDSRDFDPSRTHTAALKQQARSGVVVVMAGRVLTSAVRVVSTMVLARILTPEDYGIVGYAMTLAEFAKIFLDAGLSTSTIRAETVSDLQLSTLFWLNLAIGGGLTAAVAITSRLLTLTTLDARICDVLLAVSVTFLISGAAAQPLALLKRRLQFPRVVVGTAIASLTSLATGIWLALSGWGLWSLALMQIVNSSLQLATYLLLSGWYPKARFALSAVKEEIGFGLQLTGFQFVNYLTRRSDNLIIGTFLGAGMLGIYSKAYELLMLPITQVFAPLNNVILPVLCRASTTPGEVGKYYRRSLNGLAWLSLPIMGVCIGYPGLIVRFLLGEQWLECVPIFRILAIAGCFQPLYSSLTWIFTATGRGQAFFNWGLLTGIPMVLGFFIAIPYGVVAFAYAYCIVLIGISLPLGIRSITRISEVTFKNIVEAYSQPFLIVVLLATAAAFTEAPLLRFCGHYLSALLLGCSLLVGAIAVTAILLPSARSELNFWLRNVNDLVQHNRNSIAAEGPH